MLYFVDPLRIEFSIFKLDYQELLTLTLTLALALTLTLTLTLTLSSTTRSY
jgi:hypothetical protein